MKNFDCQCGSKLFFSSLSCVSCGALVAICPRCREVASLSVEDHETGAYRCNGCDAPVELCENRRRHEVCNGACSPGATDHRCRYCRLNSVIPDLTVEGNLEKWRRIETAKRRVLFDVDQIGLPLFVDKGDGDPVLRFELLAGDSVPMGHASGLITLHVDEADSLYREKMRVQFGEPQRTLVGHIRHELGHYFWEVCVRGQRLDEYRRLFGDERNPTYAEAKEAYYARQGNRNWQSQYISEYASMHSWEDFAETFNAYLDMIAIVGTARHFARVNVSADASDFEQLLVAYTDVGIIANELNRDIGLLDLVPEIFTPAVVEKLQFVHSLRVVVDEA